MRAIPETAMIKQAPAPESGDIALSAPANPEQSFAPTTSEPIIDVLWSIIAVLGVVVFWLIVEVIISKKISKINN